jgi:hypothetical protein
VVSGAWRVVQAAWCGDSVVVLETCSSRCVLGKVIHKGGLI